MRRLFYNIAALLIIAAALWIWIGRDRPQLPGALHAIDGDSLRGPQGDIRLYGIDAPELHQICLNIRSEPYPCGRASLHHLERLMADKPVTCRAVDQDRYRRTVAVCLAGAEELNRRMVEDGWATAYERFPSVYSISEDRARAMKRGLWQGYFDRPRQWREREAITAGSRH